MDDCKADTIVAKAEAGDHDSPGCDNLGESRVDHLLKRMEVISARAAVLARKFQLPGKQVLTLEEASLVLGRTARHLRNQLLLHNLSVGSAFDPTELNGHRKGDGKRAAWDIDVNEVFGFKTEVIVPMPRSSVDPGGDIPIRGIHRS